MLLQIGSAFLQPFDLNSDASTFTADNTSGPVHQALATTLDPQAVQVYHYKPYSPAGGGQAPENSTVTANSRWAQQVTRVMTRG
jgi:hypothetical protein